MRERNDQGRTHLAVTCDGLRESLSARWDSEAEPLPAAHVDAHLETCEGCAAWAEQAPGVLRPLRMRRVSAVPDLTERVLSAILAATPRPSLAATLARSALVAMAIAQAVLAIGLLVAASGASDGLRHATHEAGAWNLALAIALATAGLRPRMVWGVLPTVGTLTAVIVVASIGDLSGGHVHVDQVLGHSLMVLGLLALCWLAWTQRGAARLRSDSRSVSRAADRSAEQPAIGRVRAGAW